MSETPSSRFRKPVFRPLGFLLAGEISAILVYRSGSLGPSFGALTLLLLAVTVILAALAAREIAAILAGRQVGMFSNVLLTIGAVMFCLIVFETGLWLRDTLYPARTHLAGITAPLSLPAEWRRSDAQVPGALWAYYWHGKLHAHNQYGLRQLTEYSVKSDDVSRIMVLGDSLTYGVGVAEEDTYVRLLERELSRECRVEILNHGFCGANGPQLLDLLKFHAPRWKPDLIVYGICINDYLPYGHREYDRTQHKQCDFPLPDWFKSFMINSSRLGEFLDKEYDAVLMRLKLRHDFMSAIMHDFDSYRTRFAEELAEMNRLSVENGSGPILAMVLESEPSTKGTRHEVNQLTEKLATQAGMIVVPIEEHERKYDGRSFAVSRWEGHPNEEAHRLFAELLLPAIKDIPAIKPCRK